MSQSLFALTPIFFIQNIWHRSSNGVKISPSNHFGLIYFPVSFLFELDLSQIGYWATCVIIRSEKPWIAIKAFPEYVFLGNKNLKVTFIPAFWICDVIIVDSKIINWKFLPLAFILWKKFELRVNFGIKICRARDSWAYNNHVTNPKSSKFLS